MGFITQNGNSFNTNNKKKPISFSGLCSNCGGTGNVGNGRTCSVCRGSGSNKQTDFGKTSPYFICKGCSKKGKIDRNCPNCTVGKTQLPVNSIILNSKDRQKIRDVEKRERELASIHKKRKSDIVVQRTVTDDAGRPRRWFVSRITGKPVDEIDRWTGFRITHK